MIEVCNLERSFGAHKILDGVSFCIDRGESVVIIGRSGGVESVLLKQIRVAPSGGETNSSKRSNAFRVWYSGAGDVTDPVREARTEWRGRG